MPGESREREGDKGGCRQEDGDGGGGCTGERNRNRSKITRASGEMRRDLAPREPPPRTRRTNTVSADGGAEKRQGGANGKARPMFLCARANTVRGPGERSNRQQPQNSTQLHTRMGVPRSIQPQTQKVKAPPLPQKGQPKEAVHPAPSPPLWQGLGACAGTSCANCCDSGRY